MQTNRAPAAPRGAGRPRTFELERVLDQAIIVFSERGYSGTSISDLGAATGLTAGSIYKAFADKRAVFLAAFERYLTLRNAQLEQALAAAPTGRARVQAVLAHYAASSGGAEGLRGCLVVHSVLALSAAEAGVGQQVAQALHLNESRLAALIRQGQEDGSLPPHLDGATTARLLLCIMQGMRVIGKTGRSHQEMADLVDQAMKVLA